MKSRFLPALAMIPFVAALVVATGWAAPEPAVYSRETSRPVADVVAALGEAARAHQFRVSNVHDLAASLKKDGFIREPYVVVEVCNPRIADAVLKADPRFGTLMPCRIAVYRQGETTVLATVLPSHLMALFPGSRLKETAALVDRAMKGMIDQAVQEPADPKAPGSPQAREPANPDGRP